MSNWKDIDPKRDNLEIKSESDKMICSAAVQEDKLFLKELYFSIL